MWGGGEWWGDKVCGVVGSGGGIRCVGWWGVVGG